MLTAADIGPNLVGRHGELFWPDNNSWYLVQIKSVDMVTRTAKVSLLGWAPSPMPGSWWKCHQGSAGAGVPPARGSTPRAPVPQVLYATGELEELELDEMAQEQHMSLILPPGGRG